ncbi:iron-sulfur cluster assembly protein 1 [Phtheirospermum japonicum]|uniref:Iron-sulfur cluster assembly protein 1 n=1 Tax=Phtheirospermum japonicum TaxID=374723 RepID=A0A830BEL7_9LAMI|nr:iron-sulfur cluster assembly protein 1 [Phtheirospermum japonicum]
MLRHVTNKILGQGCDPLRRMYHERVVDHYSNLRNVGSFDKSDPNVETGLIGAPSYGDVMKLQIKVDEESRRIVDACFQTFRCGSDVAFSSVGMCFSPKVSYLNNT